MPAQPLKTLLQCFLSTIPPGRPRAKWFGVIQGCSPLHLMASVPVGLQENCQAMARAVPCLKLWKSGMLYSSTLSSGRANCATQTRDVSRRVYLERWRKYVCNCGRQGLDPDRPQQKKLAHSRNKQHASVDLVPQRNLCLHYLSFLTYLSP